MVATFVLCNVRSHRGPWKMYRCPKAAEGDALDLLQWARANGCPWDRSTGYKAEGDGHIDAFEWALSTGRLRDHENCGRALLEVVILTFSSAPVGPV